MVETRSASRKKHGLEPKHDKDEAKPKKTKTSKKATEHPTAKRAKKEPTTKAEEPTETTTKATEEPAVTSKPIMHESSMVEKGHIYFFYRPKVEHTEAHNAGDVQRLYMVLRPHKEAEGPLGKNRLIVMASKKLPDPKTHSHYWGFVELASDDIADITNKLEPATYETKTRGERHVEGCRPCGCGVYSVVHHLEGPYRSSQHTHIAYVLEVPEKLGPVQHSFQIEREGSFIVTVKNPESTETRGLGSSQRAAYPKELQEKFGTRKFIPAEPVSLLDYDGAEMIFIGAKEDIVEELGEVAQDLEETAEKEEKKKGKKGDHRCNLAEDQVYHKMHMHHKDHPAEPLIDGKWE